MNSFQRSWSLLKNSLSVIARNKQLLIFPVVTFICTAFIVLFFLAPPVLRPTGYSYTSTEHWKAIGNSLFRESAAPNASGGSQVVLTKAALAYLAFLYLVAMFIATFCNVAFFHEILEALGGEPVIITRGLKFAVSRLGPIVMWTLFAGLVGLIIQAISERAGWVGRLIARLIGAVWSVASVFAIPVIVRQEGANPLTVLRNSAQILRRTWGEALIGYAGLGIANTILVLGSLVGLIGAVALSLAVNQPWFIVVAVAGWLVALFIWGYVSGVASQVYKAALYIYAADGVIAEPYNQELLDMAWKRKKAGN